MYDLRLIKNLSWKHREGIKNRIMSENSPSIRKRLKNLLLGRSLKKLAQTNCISLETLDRLVKNYFLKPTDTLLIIRYNGEEKDLNMTITVKDLIPKLTRPWL